jgi:energy-coupling factor transport system ATP-binding protein
MIDLHKVCFSYANAKDLDCVKDLELHVRKGEFVVLTGESGSGKTTVTRIINGLAPAFYEGKLAGEVCLAGEMPRSF